MSEWKWVPVEPTDAMINAAEAAHANSEFARQTDGQVYGSIYRAMLAAATAEAGNAIEDRNVWKRVVPPEEVGAEPDAERQFPMQDGPPIPWSLARAIYAGYVALFGCEQSLERIAERQGFGWSEVPFLYGRPQSRAAIDAAMGRTKC
jgi:hypothetical protein